LAYTAGDIITRVQQRIRDTGYSSTEILGYINDTQNDIFNEYRLPFMQTSENFVLTANDPDITSGTGLPANYVQALDIMLTSSGRESVLTYVDVREIDQSTPDPDDVTINPASIPTQWYYYADTIRLSPAPNDALTATMRYFKKPTELDTDDDVPEVPSEFREVLVVGAAYRVLQVKDNYDQASILQNKYDELLQKLVVKYSQPQVGTPIRMRINRNALGKTNF